MTAGLVLREMGQGADRALLLHCGQGVSGMWKGVARLLADRLTMVAPDLPGHGRSAPFAPGRDVHDQACDAIRPLLRDGIHVVGHSFGATVALRLALEAPERIATLTVVEPVLFAAARGSASFATHQAAEEAFYAPTRSGDLATAAREMNRIWGGGVKWDSLRSEAQALLARQMPFVAATEPALWHDCHGLMAAGRLEQLACPVALIRGSETVPVIADIHRGLMARLPCATDHVVAGAGHMLTVTHPEDVARVVAAQLDLATA
ncbi:alpha/beta fold hydrolase [Thetidibacter halocola]|uniref:Alpha/beta hydrolase n=1 Tax=Thetidibacter halocola TaxID=2827239 RepID=A0A8J7WBZ4_9RHOB|nr:alpha/beta hydrolase [Thetidibacter halocola]MBS0124765.1 alpha/beta hydrolase [Thetidibacter halocola]